MQVNNAIDAIIIILHLYPLTKRTHVITNGQFAGRCAPLNTIGLLDTVGLLNTMGSLILYFLIF